MLPEAMIRDWARRLMAAEGVADRPCARTERVFEKLRKQLCASVGVDAFQALAARALCLTKSQSRGLGAVSLTADGGLHDLGKLDRKRGEEEEVEVGIVLIAHLLRLFLALLGKGATVCLIEDMSPRVELETEPNTTGKYASASDTDLLGPFGDIFLEADRLRHVSERLETLADNHAGIDEMATIAESIRNIAATLDVFTIIRSRAGNLHGKAHGSSADGLPN